MIKMFPGLDPKMLKQAMKKLGMKQEEIQATKVIIECSDKNLIIENPQVLKVNAMGQETLQITGNITESNKELFTEEDIKTVMEQANTTREKAIQSLKEKGDIAAAILSLQ